MVASRLAAVLGICALVGASSGCGGKGSQTGGVAQVTLTPAMGTVAVGSTAQFSATATDASGNPVSGITFSWASGAPTAFSVDDTGKVTGLSAGTGTLEATTQGSGGTVTGSATVTVNGSGQRTLSITVNGTGNVTSAPAGIDCGNGGQTCSAPFAQGSVVVLTANGTRFQGWSGPCTGTGSCSVTMSTDPSVVATFGAGVHTLNVGMAGNSAGTVISTPSGISCGGGTGACASTFPSGTSITLTATPGSGASFGGWSGGGCSGQGSCTFTLDADTTVTATFNAIVLPTLTVAVNGPGSVTSSPPGINCPSGNCSASFASGTLVTLTQTPSANAVFTGWSGACSGMGSCAVTVSANAQVTANFAANPTISVTLSGSGTGSVTVNPGNRTCSSGTCTYSYASGTQLTLAASAGASSAFSGWSGACLGSASCSVTLTANTSVGASFGATHNLSVTVAGPGSVSSSPAGINCTSGTCTVAFSSGTQVTLTAAPGTKALFSGWSGACTGTGTTCTLTLSADQSATAPFVPGSTLSVTLSGAGSGSVTSAPAGINCASGTCSALLPTGTQVSLTATASGGAAFTGWSGGCTGSSSPCSLTLNADTSVGAAFATTQTLSVTLSGQGTVISSPAGINCSSGTCNATFLTGTAVTLTQTPAPSWAFLGWSGDCSGSASCVDTLNAHGNVTASFGGPFDFALQQPSLGSPFSMVPNETRLYPLGVKLLQGAPGPVTLSVSGLPPGVSASISPNPVTPDATATISFTSTAAAALGQATVTLTGAATSNTHSVPLALEVRSPYGFNGSQELALESAGSTALVTETDRLVRVRLSDFTVVKTLASGLGQAYGVAIENGGNTVLVNTATGLVRVDFTTQLATSITTALTQPWGVAIESGGATALITDCGTGTCATTGRLARVTLSSGAVTAITSGIGLATPRDIAVEAGGATALVVESGGSLVRVNVTTGVVSSLTSGLTQFSGVGPTGVAIESGGATALVTSQWTQAVYRVHLATGTRERLRQTGFSCCALGIAIEASGNTAVYVESNRLLRLNVVTPEQTLAPARQSADVLYNAAAVALEASGTTALVTDCGATSCNAGQGRIVRVDLTAGTVSPIATGLFDPRGIAIESGGAKALVVEHGAWQLTEVTLAGGALTVIAPLPGFNTPQGPVGIAIEAGGATALVSDESGTQLSRVTLATGTVTPVSTASWKGLAIESGGTTALTFKPVSGNPNNGQLNRVTLVGGSAVPLAAGLGSPIGVAIESGGTTALVTDQNEGGRLYRVNLGTGQLTVLANWLGSPQQFALDGSGNAIIAETTRLVRVNVGVGATPSSVAQGLNNPTGFALESGGTTAIILDCGAGPSPACNTTGRVARLTLSTGAVAQVGAFALNTPTGLLIEPGGATALVTDCGPITMSCSQAGRLLRIDLTSGAATVLISGLNQPAGLGAQSASNVLIAESGSGRILSGDTTGGGGVLAVGVGLSTPRYVQMESGGLTAIVGDGQGVARVTFSTQAFARLSQWTNGPFQGALGLAIEPGNVTALLLGTGGFSGATEVSLARINLTSGALAVLASPHLFDTGGALALDGSGANAYVVEDRVFSGAILTLPTPTF